VNHDSGSQSLLSSWKYSVSAALVTHPYIVVRWLIRSYIFTLSLVYSLS